jgi:hypothetical protein
MMRCDCCNRRLNDYESTLKHAELGCYMNTCVKCLKSLGIPTVGRDDLAKHAVVEDIADDDLYDQDAEDEFERDVHKLIFDDTVGDESWQ